MERAMNSGDDLFDDAEGDAAEDEFNRHCEAIFQYIEKYIDEHELIEEMMSLVLLNLCIKLRMLGYGLYTEKPSVAGLKLDLDRFRREVDDALRAVKKDADRFIAEVRTARAAAESEIDEEPDDQGNPP
jgi:hypothetical protein